MSQIGPLHHLSVNASRDLFSGIGRLRLIIAISFLVHVLLFIVFINIRFANPLASPLSSYNVSLVNLPKVDISSRKKTRESSEKHPSSPVKSKASQSFKPQTVKSRERLTDSFTDAVAKVFVPERRTITSVKGSSIPEPESISPSLRRRAADSLKATQSSPKVPKLTSRKPLLANSKKSFLSPRQPDPVAPTFKQAMESVSVPQKSPLKLLPASAKSKMKSRPQKVKKSTIQSERIVLPSQTPSLSELLPRPRSTKKLPEKKTKFSDSLEKAVEAVVVPKIQKSTPASLRNIELPLISESQSSQVRPQPKIQKGLDLAVLAPPVPELAEIDLQKVAIQELELPVGIKSGDPRTNIVGQKIAKLMIPEIQFPKSNQSRSQETENQLQKVLTTLQISGFSQEGNPYWARVTAKIDSEWVPPPVAAQPGQTFEVLLALRLEQNGEINNLIIERSSGNEYYDFAAKRAVLTANPLPPFPQEMKELYYDLQFQFIVNEERL